MNKKFDICIAAEMVLENVYRFSRTAISDLYVYSLEFGNSIRLISTGIGIIYELYFYGKTKKSIQKIRDKKNRAERTFSMMTKEDKEKIYKILFGGNQDILIKYVFNNSIARYSDPIWILDLGNAFKNPDPYENLENLLKHNNLLEEACIASDLKI